jgi:hypothetical protein
VGVVEVKAGKGVKLGLAAMSLRRLNHMPTGMMRSPETKIAGRMAKARIPV